MDASNVFRQVEGFGTPQPRLPHDYHPVAAATVPARYAPPRQHPRPHPDHHSDADSHRIAHTLTACSRCRQRKTRCDPTLPRCLPCERSGSTCEYFDTTKGKKINRFYVVKLQERVRALEAELGQYTDEDDLPKDHEDYIRPGGFIRLNENDETPRYLGPSSGIAMTRLLMEEAKKYTESKRIAELIPDVRARRRTGSEAKSRAMSRAASRKKSFPMTSAVAAQALPTRVIADRLVEVFNQRAQVFTPTLHEQHLVEIIDQVYADSQDPYQNFVARLVMAISLQKLDSTYAGLADSYYLAAMQHFEDVVRPKDIRTLQCLVLIGQYSLLTPTRTSVYYVVGLATRISQQLGLADEKTIAIGAENAQVIDIRRRVGWSVVTMEFGLAHSMGRPSGFAKTSDVVDLGLFDPGMDCNITRDGIHPGPPDEKKLVAIQFCKMRTLQAEIRRVLYEQKHTVPQDDRHPWFAMIEQKMAVWLNEAPENPAWCKPWFTGRYHTMIVTIHRPSPQVPRPSVLSATKCFNSAAFVIDISSKQVKAAAVDITWVFLLTLYMALNALLWSVTYHEVRALHSREEVQDLVITSLDIIDQCSERWPGTAAASSLYSTFAKACLQSYESRGTPTFTNSSFGTPPSVPETQSPPGSETSSATTVSRPNVTFNPPQFGAVFDSAPEQVNFDSNPFPAHPSFRSNSIFHNPATSDHTGRRFSYFPPDFTQTGEPSLVEDSLSTSPGTESTMTPPFYSPPQNNIGTPPNMATTPLMSNTPMTVNSDMLQTSPAGASVHSTPGQHQQQQHHQHHQPQQQQQQPRPLPQQRQQAPVFTIPPPPPQHRPQGQQPLPPVTTVTDWFNPPPPFISPYAFGGMTGGVWNDASGMGNMGGPDQNATPFAGMSPERQGSLSQEQQAELMKILEDEGMTDIDTYLNMGMGFGDGGIAAGNHLGGAGINWNGV